MNKNIFCRIRFFLYLLCFSLFFLFSLSSTLSNPLNILKVKSQERTYYLTFDCHDNNGNLNYILRTLKKHSVKATFFITGYFIKKFPNDVKNILKNRHIIGNHTLTHRKFSNSRSLLYEIRKTEQLFKKLTGKNMTKIWRAPYLQHLSKKWMLISMKNAGYQHIDVSLFSTDWITKKDYRYISNKRFLRIFKNRLDCSRYKRIHIDASSYKWYQSGKTSYNGIIMLMHAGKYRKFKRDFVYCLDTVIGHLKKNNYKFMTFEKFEI